MCIPNILFKSSVSGSNFFHNWSCGVRGSEISLGLTLPSACSVFWHNASLHKYCPSACHKYSTAAYFGTMWGGCTNTPTVKNTSQSLSPASRVFWSPQPTLGGYVSWGTWLGILAQREAVQILHLWKTNANTNTPKISLGLPQQQAAYFGTIRGCTNTPSLAFNMSNNRPAEGYDIRELEFFCKLIKIFMFYD